MSDVTTLEGDVVVGSGARFAIVSGRFNDFIVNQLEAGCIDALCRHGVTKSDITLARVPGAFEIPLTAKKLAQSNNFAAVITLGAVIRGSTPHFEYVCSTCASGVSQASLETHVPIVFGVAWQTDHQ